MVLVLPGPLVCFFCFVLMITTDIPFFNAVGMSPLYPCLNVDL